VSGLTGALVGIAESVILPAVVAGVLIKPVFRLADALEEHGGVHDPEQEETA
jgi:hypothetical protein